MENNSFVVEVTFKIEKRFAKTNQCIITEHCISNDDKVLVVSSKDKKIVWKSYHKKLLKI